MLGAGTKSGVNFEPMEGNYANGASEVVMMIYGGWRYVKHNEQNINMRDKPTVINDVRDANDGL